MKRYTKPIHLPRAMAHRAADSSLALINVVFLLLVFLLVAGTLKPTLPEHFEWAETSSGTGNGSIQGSLVLVRSGEVWFEGERLEAAQLETFLQGVSDETDRLAVQVDKRAKMEAVAALADRLRANGIKHLTLVTIEADGP
ncbi:biopolymer transporter ExbD [Labrenzia sp. 011]|uniref:ExbD/TolR family protein n=1 Tax=Labrenzia sp. 011 TaxID=2171494 RepID=UPI000D511E54|nr:biopolymer transporter ExbD [Labrenzia sp. 011]PVB63594.1 hypothetical protein DCO57_02030 [Labrenzia sp. 011]